MTDFWTMYDGTDRIQLGQGIWVDVKKSLTTEESKASEKALISTTFNEKKPDKPDIAIDATASLFEQVLVSIVDWNLPPRDGKAFDLDHDPDNEKLTGRPSPRRLSLQRLPASVYDEIAKVVGRNNAGMPRAQEATFPDGGELGAEVELDDQSDNGQVLEGTGVLAAVGDSPGPATDDAAAVG